jgi:hypothetical protein
VNLGFRTEFRTAAAKKPRTFDQYDDVLNRLVVPELGEAKANKVTITDVAKLHRKVADTPYQANRMLAVVNSMTVAPQSTVSCHGGSTQPKELTSTPNASAKRI